MPVDTWTDYAERVLFAETLEEKLRIAASVAEEPSPVSRPVPSLSVEPGRPVALRFRDPETGERSKFPSLAQLTDNECRGRLFHFFANHELMAAELMALALLRFPEAPLAFRQGLLETMREEQLHTRWYVERMRACGVEFGSHTLSRFFWDAVAPMETPLDYVTRLSLTFEQANLDYTRHYAAALREVGDEASARLLDRIYRDEIQHVGYGLRWFREWKRPGQSDWEAYRGLLPFPLSPSRAKGNGAAFNEAGRIEAGLDAAFVNALALFERSRGRTPNVFWFNADAEEAMARGLNGGGYQATKGVARFVADLEPLAIFLSRRDDLVLVRREPRREYLERMRALGFDLPEFEVVAGEMALAAESLTRRRKLHDLRPWGWEPRSAALLEPLRGNLPASVSPPHWSQAVRSRFSKAAQMARFPVWEPGDETWRSHPCETADEVEAARGEIQAAHGGGIRIVVKAAFSAAGRGLRWDDQTGSDRRSHPVRSESVVVEPWADRVFDFSVQYEMGADGLRLLGFCRQIVDGRGRYRGTQWSPKFCRGLEAGLAQFLMETALPRYEEGTPFVRDLAAWLNEGGYSGPVGVDAFVHRDSRGRLRHRLMCEVNPRHTMGRLTWELSRKVAPGRAVRLEIVKRASVPHEDTEVECDGRGRLARGTVLLNDPAVALDWLAQLTVGE